MLELTIYHFITSVTNNRLRSVRSPSKVSLPSQTKLFLLINQHPSLRYEGRFFLRCDTKSISILVNEKQSQFEQYLNGGEVPRVMDNINDKG